MNFDLTTTLWYFVGIALVVITGVVATTVNQLMGIRIRRPRFQLVDQNDIPQYLLDTYQHAVSELNELGFELHHYQLSSDIIAHQHADKYSVVLLNRQSKVYAEISPASTFLDLPGYEVDFWSIATDGKALLTINGRGHTLLCNIPGAELHDPMEDSLADIYDSHLAEQKDVFSDTPLTVITPDSYINLQQKLIDGYFVNLIKEGGVVSTGSNTFRVTLTKAFNLAHQLRHGEKRLAKLIHKKAKSKQEKNDSSTSRTTVSDNRFSVEAEVNAYRRLRSAQEKTPGSIISKLIIFFLTLAFSYVAFGLVFSFSSVLILMAVILFHELGHIAAMYAFKYRDLQILFIPLLGAAATGKKDDIAVWKQVIVYLMGPLPGIILGIGLIALYQQYQAAWLYETAIIMLIINYLNLLPFVPLDGGHIVRLTIMERFPTGKLMFSALSALAFVAGAWYLGEPIFWVLAILMASSLPWSALEAGLLSELYQQPNTFDKLDNKQKLYAIFETLKNAKFQKLRFAQKFNLVKSLSEVVLQSRHLNRLGALGLGGLYLSALLLTPPAFMVTVVGFENTASIISMVSGNYSGQQWDSRIANEESSDKRLQLILQASQFYSATNDLMKAQGYLEQAERTIPLVNTENALADLYQAYFFYYNQKQDFILAEEHLLKAINLYHQLPVQNALKLATSHQTLAGLYYQQQRLEDYESQLKSGLSYALQIQKPEERFIISGIIEQLLEQYVKGNKPESIKTLLEDTLASQTQYTDPLSNYITSYLYQELGRFHSTQGNVTQSMQQFQHALKLTENNVTRNTDSDPLAQANIYLDMATLQYNAGDNNLAKAHLASAEKIVKANNFESLEQYINLHIQPQTNSELSSQNTRETKRWQSIAETVNSSVTSNSLP